MIFTRMAITNRQITTRQTPFIGLLQHLNVKFFHFEKRLGHSRQSLSVFILEHLVHCRGNNLPRDAIFIFQPAALLRLWICGKLSPVVINFLLRLAVHHERNGFIESKVVFKRAVHGSKFQPLKHESGVLYCSNFIRLFTFAVAVYIANFCIVEHSCVKINRFFCFSVLVADEQKRRGDFLLYLMPASEHCLPGKAVPVLDPSISLAERIFTKLHECRASF